MKPTRIFAVSMLGAAFLGGLCGVILCYVFMGASVIAEADQQVSRLIRAEVIEIVDGNGKVRAFLGVLSDGTTGLSVYEPNGDSAVRLGLLPSGHRGINVFDHRRNLRILAEVSPDGRPAIGVLSADSKSNVALSMLSETEPKIEIKDQQNQVVWSAP